ncbi:MAG: hypothetical protein JW795_05275 [Chitinivibrionales bacterium]|nr:hypothetical protein [Chitinivibrionales bacterium]
MNCLVFDETRKRRIQIERLLQEKGHQAKTCFGSGELMQLIDLGTIDRIFIDVESWCHSRAIFNYFNFAKRIQGIPIVFYNAPDTFVTLHDRNQHASDKVMHKNSTPELIVNEVV